MDIHVLDFIAWLVVMFLMIILTPIKNNPAKYISILVFVGMMFTLTYAVIFVVLDYNIVDINLNSLKHFLNIFNFFKFKW